MHRNDRRRIAAELMGKIVNVVVDRPVGYRHGDLVYPLNYGYIPDVFTGDGEEQDAYILGISEPVTAFEGPVIAVIHRKDDCEDKLVVAPQGMVYNQAQILEAVHFQEQYFTVFVDSLLRCSCGVIPFREVARKREYLVLLQANHCWSFPKGHMEPGETERQTALRELYEETGLTAVLVPGARTVSEYSIPPHTRKRVVLFLGEVCGDMKLQSTEILDYRWVTADALKDYLHPDTYADCLELLGQ